MTVSMEMLSRMISEIHALCDEVRRRSNNGTLTQADLQLVASSLQQALDVLALIYPSQEDHKNSHAKTELNALLGDEFGNLSNVVDALYISLKRMKDGNPKPVE